MIRLKFKKKRHRGSSSSKRKRTLSPSAIKNAQKNLRPPKKLDKLPKRQKTRRRKRHVFNAVCKPLALLQPKIQSPTSVRIYTRTSDRTSTEHPSRQSLVLSNNNNKIKW